MPQQFKRRILKYLPKVKAAILLGLSFILFISLLRLLTPVYRFAKENNISANFLLSLVFDKDTPIKKYRGRTNVLLLGIAGSKYDGTDLTDTIILLSLDFLKKDSVMLSVPRDIWLSSLKDKVNSAYHYGEDKKKGGGFILAKSAVEEIVGLPIHYIYLVDFFGITRLVDMVGGVDIFVEDGFTDNYYPIAGKENDLCAGDPTFACRFEQLKFEAGWQHMNGDRVLKYVRSREAKGSEGTDFARSKRQQQLIMALKNKVLAIPFSHLEQIKKWFYAFNDTVSTDMNWSEKLIFFKFLANLPDGKIRSLILDTGEENKGRKGFLINPPPERYNGVWVLIPRTGDFRQIQEYITCQLENPACSLQP